MAKRKKTLELDVVFIQEGDWWSAQVLQYDIAAQARSLPQLRREVERVVLAHFLAAQAEGVEPFEGIGRAPQEFWDMYEMARDRIVREDDTDLTSPEGFILPAYQIKVAEARSA
jgi:hypothetical protein